MKDSQPKTIYLKDYQAPDYWIDKTDLVVDITDEITTVTSTLQFKLNNNKSHDKLPELVLHGRSMVLESVAIDGEVLSPQSFVQTDQYLIFQPVNNIFTTTIVTLLRPQDNTSLEGLYKSGDMYCTQCEAEGFRKITYYLDRPDVMSVFTTKIIADKTSYPVLLSNGNAIESGDLQGGRHFVTWKDPFKKPAYLFALVAGNLEYIEDTFTTMSGQQVMLRIFTESHNINKCDHAMLSLKRSMSWDERIYGREYDLDIFMIVAVDAFNMGAMENKGLNIFNSACVLANSKTSTDASFQRIESIVGHEYFHNWSGNRVTCRDWFQLSLKEGFTVFRDQEFSSDMNSRSVKRIEDVNILRNAQFVEDAGPLAHPIRPDSFIEISNFYTSTVYDKGAEVVRMIHNILGKKNFRKGSDLYFKRHDGQAVTCDDFVQAMEDASGTDLTQFRHWYSQSGTPVLDVTDEYDEDLKLYKITIKQFCPPTPGQAEKKPFHIPVAMGLLTRSGQALMLNSEGEYQIVLSVKKAEETFEFKNIPSRPLPSLLRGFSAPVKVNYHYTRDELVTLMSHDVDGFNRWDCAQRLSVDIIKELTLKIQQEETPEMDDRVVDAYEHLLNDESSDPAMIAEMLHLPSVSYVGEQMERIDVNAIYKAREFVKQRLSNQLYDTFRSSYNKLNVPKSYIPEAADIAVRSLKNVCLSYIMNIDNPKVTEMAKDQFDQANNMTDSMAVLSSLVNGVHARSEVTTTLLERFAKQWKTDNNVMDMWFSVQARAEMTDLGRLKQLMQHECFDFSNPNKLRSVIGAFCAGNTSNFHALDHSGYDFLAEQIISLDEINPQMASRLMIPLTRWKRYAPQYQAGMKKAIETIKNKSDLSPDVFEVVSRALV